MTAKHDPKAKASLGNAMIAEAADGIAKCLAAEGITNPAPVSLMLAVHYAFETARDRWGMEGIRLLAVMAEVYRAEAADDVAARCSVPPP